MIEVKFFNVNLKKHVILRLNEKPSPCDCICLTKDDNTKIHYRVLSSEEMTDRGIDYSEGLEDLEDIPDGIEEITLQEFSNFEKFTSSNSNEYKVYNALIPVDYE